MDFKATNWLERNYKWLSVIILGILTICAISSYFKLSDKNYTFFVSLVYAFILFLAGIFLNYMSNTIESKINERIEILTNLRFIITSLNHEDDPGLLENVITRIAQFQILTGRREGINSHDEHPIITNKGVKFDTDELVIESEFEVGYYYLRNLILDIIGTYINENHLELRTQRISINTLFGFEPELWCQDTLANYNEHGHEMVMYLYRELENIRNDIDSLEWLGLKVMNLYDMYLAQAKENIKHIERLYGRKLHYKMQQQGEMQRNFQVVLDYIHDVNENLSTKLNAHDNRIERYMRSINEMSQALNDIAEQIDGLPELIDEHLANSTLES